jgi:hypothetical protein
MLFFMCLHTHLLPPCRTVLCGTSAGSPSLTICAYSHATPALLLPSLCFLFLPSTYPTWCGWVCFSVVPLTFPSPATALTPASWSSLWMDGTWRNWDFGSYYSPFLWWQHHPLCNVLFLSPIPHWQLVSSECQSLNGCKTYRCPLKNTFHKSCLCCCSLWFRVLSLLKLEGKEHQNSWKWAGVWLKW